ncbi:protein of unknown function [Candidatus Nitrosocosmicus franklandus]|uniref:Uncharacterized protein n=1 Tax=Candidatus Nitrosocosmicus franklandianus TaxID=1798806 RepID=A0A484IFN3_9ARCH|nr:protein of unknown function [Candidatus Nitrosocosmicus franklandus]
MILQIDIEVGISIRCTKFNPRNSSILKLIKVTQKHSKTWISTLHIFSL